MTDWRYLPDALHSQYGSDVQCCTACTKDTWQITLWESETIEQPSETELKALVDAYIAAMPELEIL
jgi:hypothetical protein